MITIIWIAMAVTVLGSIELLARAATSKRSAVEADDGTSKRGADDTRSIPRAL